MRDIKFRAWDKDDKVMRNWNELILEKDKGDDFYLLGYEESRVVTSYDHEQILMQYTGLTDKDGTEIYEGDILNGGFLIDQHIHDCIGLLVFKNYGFIVEVPGFGDEDLFDWKDAETLEVIGNIYENPELLEVE